MSADLAKDTLNCLSFLHSGKQGESYTLIDVNYILSDEHYSVSEISA